MSADSQAQASGEPTERGFACDPFRPFRPLDTADGALFFGRTAEVAMLQARLNAASPADASMVLLLGETGVGKTSLLRAGLIPALAAAGTTLAWVDGVDLAHASPPDGAADGLLVVDDVGAALDGGPAQERLERLLGAALAARGTTILVIDDEDLWRAERLDAASACARALRQAARVRLERFDRVRSAEVIERTILAGGGYLEAGLSEALAADLARTGPVLPATLQLVAGEVVARRLSTERAYARSGGPHVLTWRFFERATAAAGGARARRVLAALASAEPHERLALDDLARDTGLERDAVERLVAAWAGLRLVRATEAGGGSAVLAAEWVRPLARSFTGDERARAVAARLLLKRLVDRRGLLLPWQLREVKRHAGVLGPDEQAVVKRSTLVLAAAAGVLVLVPLVVLALLYGAAGRSYHFDLVGEGPGARVVTRLGPEGRLAWMPHRPPVGTVTADLGFLRSALAAPRPPAGGRVGEDPLRRIQPALRPLPRAALALLENGDVKPLAAAFADPALRPAAVELLGLAGRGTAEEAELLTQALSDESEEVRRLAVRAAASLEKRAPGAGAPVLSAAAQDASPTVRGLALTEIGHLPDEAAAALLVSLLENAKGPAQKEAGALLAKLLAAPTPVELEAARVGFKVRTISSPSALAIVAQALRGPARAQAEAALARFYDATSSPIEAADRVIADVALDGGAPVDVRVAALRLLRWRTIAGMEAITGPPEVLAAALPLVIRAKPDAAGDRVAEALRGSVEQRIAAAAALALLPVTADTRNQLKALAKDPYSDVRCAALRALPTLGRAALGELSHQARAGDAAPQKAAFEALAANAQVLGVGIVAAILGAASRNGGSASRVAALKVLGAIAERDPRTVTAQLRGALRAKDPAVRAAAATALGEALAHGAKPAPQLLRGFVKDDDPLPRRAAVKALSRPEASLGPAAAQALLAFVADADAGVRAEAATSLGRLSKRGHHDHGPDRLGAAQTDVGKAFAILMRDQSPEVAAAARAAALPFRSAAEAYDAALTASLAAAPPEVRIDVARAAGRLGAVETLKLALADRDPTVRRAAAHSLGHGTFRDTSLILAALGDPDEAVRASALWSLAGSGTFAMTHAAQSPDPWLRAAALRWLAARGPEAARPTLAAALGDGSEAVRATAARSLAALGCEATTTLRQALRDPAADVRLAAAEALGDMAAAKARDEGGCAAPEAALVADLHNPADADVRLAAAFQLAGQASGPAGEPARRALDEAAKGPPAVRVTARTARAFVGRLDEMARFVRLLRTGS
jgi:HEAT repeat protein